jgi:endonuclease/exonuclease/phosphatase family metal-dependent hydrolase
MTMNIRYDCDTCAGAPWDMRRTGLEQLLSENDFSIVALQELYTVSTSEGREYVDPEQLAWLKSRFNHRFHIIHNPFQTCPGNPETLVVLLEKDRFIVVETTAEPLPTPPNYTGDERLYLMVEMIDTRTKNVLKVITTHFAIGPFTDRYRKTSAGHIRSCYGEDEHVIVLGDFNDLNFKGLFPDLQNIGVRTCTYHAFLGIPMVKIDSILYRNMVEHDSRVVTVKYGEHWASDHYPVAAVLSFPVNTPPHTSTHTVPTAASDTPTSDW